MTGRAFVGVVAAAVAVCAAACGDREKGVPDAGDEPAVSDGGVTILSSKLSPAIVGNRYDEQLRARGGVEPYFWSFDAGADLAWLELDPDSGALSGTVALGADGGYPQNLPVLVMVSDSQSPAAIASTLLSLSVFECDPGAKRSGNYTSSGSTCYLEAQECDGGFWTGSTQTPAEGSQQCGAGCAFCGVSETCSNGTTCMCGSDPDCANGESCCAPLTATGSAYCANLQRDIKNCGGCGRGCPVPDASLNEDPTCNDTCGVACKPGWQDCDAGAPGCESNQLTDVANCGACNNDCRAQMGANVVSSCVSGGCNETCAPGFFDCNNDKTDAGRGCEINGTNDVKNCGSCGHDCTAGIGSNVTPTCSNSACAYPCNAPFLDCNGDKATPGGNGCEVKGDTDPDNCGGCNHACAPPAYGTRGCSNGACTGTCPGGISVCGQTVNGGGECCIPGANEVSNTCVTSGTTHCQIICKPDFFDCNADAGDGCEVYVDGGDLNNCGACGAKCPSGADTCFDGVCYQTCLDGQTLCRMNQSCYKNTQNNWACR